MGCIADDYTGASDLANTLTRNGLRTVQTIGVPGLGLARALAAHTGARPEDAGAPVGGHAACLVGSCSAATLEQINVAAQRLPVLHLQTEKLLDGTGEAAAALGWAAARLAAGPVLIASSGAPEAVASLQARYGRERTGHAIEQAMAAQAVRRLVVAGGETSGAVVDRLGISAFQLGAEIAPGVPLLRSVGGRNTGMLLALKSGNFGDKDFFMRAPGMMQ